MPTGIVSSPHRYYAPRYYQITRTGQHDYMEENMKTENLSINNLASTHIQNLLTGRGEVKVTMLRGAPMRIWTSENGVRNSAFPTLTLEWRVFDALVAKAASLGGIMYRGDVEAQQGLAIGSRDFPLDTMDAFISVNFHGSKVGSSTIRRSTYYAAVLAWANICTNNRSTGEGGYIKLFQGWQNKY